MGKLNDQIAIITGSARGIGKTSEITFNREGAKVIVADLNVKGCEETVQMIKKAGGEAFFIRTDVSKTADVEAMVCMTIHVQVRALF